MNWFDAVDWRGMFVPNVPLVEIFLRGTLVYLALFFLLRVVLKRQSGTVGVSDLLVVVLIADASQNAMAGEYKAIPDGVLLVATIVFWCYVLDWLSFHVPWIERIVTPAPLELVRHGQMLRNNMRHELVTIEDLMSQLREQGVDDLSVVKRASMEPNGRISVVKFDQEQHPNQQQQIVG